eukprot:3502315-Prymnesium_polylepis.1
MQASEPRTSCEKRAAPCPDRWPEAHVPLPREAPRGHCARPPQSRHLASLRALFECKVPSRAPSAAFPVRRAWKTAPGGNEVSNAALLAARAPVRLAAFRRPPELPPAVARPRYEAFAHALQMFVLTPCEQVDLALPWLRPVAAC